MKNVCKMISAMLALTLTFSLSACGGKQEDGADAPVHEGAYRIGISQYGEHASLDNCREGFLQGLEQAGLKEGIDFEVDYQNAGSDDAIAIQIGQGFSATDVDLMVGIATPSAVACYAAAEDKDIPVVFTAINDPVQAKLDSGNVTGTSDKLPVADQLDLIRQLQPNAKRIGIIYTTSEPNSISTIKDYQEKAPEYGFEIEAVGVVAQSEVTQAVDTLISRDVDCFSNLTDNTVVDVLPAILEKTNDAGIPVYGSEVEQVKLGCAASAGIDYVKLGIQTGMMAAKVLRGEAACQDLPYETISESEIYLNFETLDVMGISVPDSIRERAVEVQTD